MAASPLTDIAIPNAGVAASFTAGERALQPNTTATGTLHLTRALDLLGGLYRIKIATSVPGSVWVGEDALRRVGVTGALTTVEADVFVRQGRVLLSVVLANLSAGSPWVALSIWKDAIPVYTSNADYWLWDTAPITAPTTLGDQRLTLPVWTISPNWEQGITERLTFATEVIQSEVDVEQRRSVMLAPKRAFEAAFQRAELNRMRLDTFLTGVGTTRMLAPFWPEQMRLPTLLTANNPTVNLPPGKLVGREFAPGTLALLIGQDPMNYDIVEVESVATGVSQDTITLSRMASRDWPAGTRMTPLHEVRITAQSQMSARTDRAASFSVRFDTVGPIAITPSWGYCAPVWRFKLDRSDAISFDYNRRTFQIDPGTGPVDLIDSSGEARISVRAGIKLFGRAALTSYRAFLAMARGRSQRFWWPSGTHDLEPLGDIQAGTTVVFKPTGYSKWIRQPQATKTMVAFVLDSDNQPVYRRIVSCEALTNGNDLVTFDRDLPSILRSQLLRVSFVLPVRFDQDSFEIHHPTDDAKVVRAAVVVRSAEIDDLPEIEC